MAKAYIKNEVKVLGCLQEPVERNKDLSGKNSKEENIQADNPVVEESKSRNGKEYVRIKGTHEQAEEVRQRFLAEGKKPGMLDKDRYKQGTYYFYIDHVR